LRNAALFATPPSQVSQARPSAPPPIHETLLDPPSTSGSPSTERGDVTSAYAETAGAERDEDEDQTHRLDRAEERGRQYEQHMAATFRSEDDLGDLDEDWDMVDSLDQVTSEHSPPQRPLPRPTLLRTVLNADPRFPGENDVDPFYVPCPRSEPAHITASNTHPSLFQLYLLVAWLHTQCKLAFIACVAVLVVFGHIMAAAGVVLGQGQRGSYVSLASVMTNIGVEPVFQVLTVCPKCLEPYPAGRTSATPCDRCATPLFKATKERDRQRPTAPAPARPFLQAPHMSVEAQLRAILAMPGMEDHMESWRSVERTPGTKKDIFDGDMTKDLKGPDGKPFFQNPMPSDCTELRVGVVAGLDW
jgi:hypothetical protein